MLPPGQETHEVHCCDVQIHTCTTTCPDCGVYCSLPYSHSGPHSAQTHLSKTRCITWAATPYFTYVTQEDSLDITRELTAGNSSKAETCEICCSRKGRGHAHPVLCGGRSNCLATLFPQSAVHSSGFYPDISANLDLVECSKYWEIENWKSPLAAVPNALGLFRLCPYYCGAGLLKSYCSWPIFHSNSTRPGDHSITLDADIVFLLDRTISMISAIKSVKHAIEATLRQLRTSHPALTFTIIAYKDHRGDSASVVELCPSTGTTSEYDINKSVAFLRGLAVQSGGREQRGEVTHAIYALSRMKWRETAYRLVYYFTIQGDIDAKYCVCVGTSKTAAIRPLLDEYTKVNKVDIAAKPANAPELVERIIKDLYGNAQRNEFTLELADKVKN